MGVKREQIVTKIATHTVDLCNVTPQFAVDSRFAVRPSRFLAPNSNKIDT